MIKRILSSVDMIRLCVKGVLVKSCTAVWRDGFWGAEACHSSLCVECLCDLLIWIKMHVCDWLKHVECLYTASFRYVKVLCFCSINVSPQGAISITIYQLNAFCVRYLVKGLASDNSLWDLDTVSLTLCAFYAWSDELGRRHTPAWCS